MNNKDTATCIKNYVSALREDPAWCWRSPVYAAGFEQHVKFVRYKERNWHGDVYYDREAYARFCLDYASQLDVEADDSDSW